MEDFERRHGLMEVLSEPGLRLEERFRNLLRHPAVTFAQEANEVWPAMLDFLEAQRQNLAFGLGLVRHAPA